MGWRDVGILTQRCYNRVQDVCCRCTQLGPHGGPLSLGLILSPWVLILV